MGKRIFIFGAGIAGENALLNLDSKYEVLGFLDNDENKHGMKIKGYCVSGPSTLSEVAWDKILIASEFFEEIFRQLVTKYEIEDSKISVLPSWMLSKKTFSSCPMMKVHAISVINALHLLFTNNKINYFLDAGTLLGLYRDGDFIPWDHDLDIGVFEEQIPQVENILKQVCRYLDEVTSGAWHFEKFVTSKRFGSLKKGSIRSFKLHDASVGSMCPDVDLFVKYPHESVFEYALASRLISIEKFVVTPLSTIQINNQNYSAPGNVEGYLESYYGCWKVPKRDWNVGMINALTDNE